MENGGTAPGFARFEKLTGISPRDWLGKHWPRWGDAVKEAGFQPNSLTAAYDREHILACYIELARELGKLPVNAEIRVKARMSPGFPIDGTFDKHLGTQADRVALIREYCEKREGFEDVIAMCDRYVPPPRFSKQEAGENAPGQDGFVYLMKSGRFYKIGKSNAVGRRERELAIQMPEKASTVHTIRTDDPTGIEAYWHRRFADQRRNGEWFELTKNDVAAFRRRKFM
jgi:hypothetical protein